MDTPARPKTVHTNFGYQSGELNGARLAVFEDLGFSVPQVTIEDFLKSLAPPQPKFNLNSTMESLRQDPTGILPSGRWSSFEQDPKDQQRDEGKIFLPLTEIFNKVVGIIANSVTASNSVQFHVFSRSNAIRNATRPDGYLALKQKLQEGDVLWADIFLPCEFKRKDRMKDLYDNVRKSIWSLQHIMRDDPCRRAAFAMTIENMNTRLWFSCRSSVIVSESFDFISKPDLLVKVFAAFAFANKRSLGFDPTVEHDPIHLKQFIITVHPDHDREQPRRFRTKSILSSSGAEPLRGRGTRVFEAIELDEHGYEKGSTVVLKDVWIDKDRMREGTILAQLYDEAKGDDKGLVQNYFLTTICHGDVWLDWEVVDDTEDGLMHGLKTMDNTFSLQYARDVSTSQSKTRPESLQAVNLREYCSPTQYAHKTHYRIVFKEIGITINRVPQFHDALKTLIDAVNALQLLRRLGWVHRDVSTGNILRYEGGGKLTDLEYAKKMAGDPTCHHTRTGTLHFMSIEVAARRYLSPPLLMPKTDDNALGPLDYEQEFQTESQDVELSVPWTYNHLHDLESLWWVAAWIVFNHCFSVPNDLRSDLRETPEGLRTTLFPRTLLDFRRRDSFMDTFATMEKSLPTKHQPAFRMLNGLRIALIRTYQKVQSTLPASINLDASNDTIYKVFKDRFQSLRLFGPNYTLVSILQLRAEMANLKRGGEELIDDTGSRSSKRRAVV